MKRLSCIIACAFGLFAFVGSAEAMNPPAPVNLTAHVSVQILPGIELKWMLPPVMPPIMPTVFRVFRSVDDSMSFTLFDVTAKPGYIDHKVMPGHTYYYAVTTVWMQADSTMQESGKSNIAWATVPSPGHASGEIVGTVIDSLSGSPLPGSRVTFFLRSRPTLAMLWVPQVLTDSLGQYRAVLDTGTYLVHCQPPLWMDLLMSPLPPPRPEWYKDAYDPAHATPVPVSEGSVTKILFDLARCAPPPTAHIEGTVRDSAGGSLKGALVAIMRSVQEMQRMSATNADIMDLAGESVDVDGLGSLRGVVWKGWTDSSGRFDAVVRSGEAYIAMAVKGGFMPQFYDHKNNPAEATLISLAGDVSGVDFNLNPFLPPQLYSLSGVVNDSAGVLVPSRIVVFPLRPRPSRVSVRFGYTDSLGAYRIPKMRAGKYIVLAIPFASYAPAFYKKGAFGVFRWKDADTVVVAGDVSGIDIGVVRIHCEGVAQLTGVIRSNGQPLEGVNVFAVNNDDVTVGYALSATGGAYLMQGLPAGGATLVADCEGYDPVQQSISVGATDFALAQDLSLGATTSVAGGSVRPVAFALGQNYPNPFNPATAITYELSAVSRVRLTVFDILGREVETLVNEVKQPGTYTVAWHAAPYASGVYFYRLQAGQYVNTRKMVLLK